MDKNPMGAVLVQLIFIGIVFLVFYFLILKPQQTQRKRHAEFVASLKKGDKVITSSGIWGTIVDIGDMTVDLKVDSTAKIKVSKESIIAYQPTKEKDQE